MNRTTSVGETPPANPEALKAIIAANIAELRK